MPVWTSSFSSCPSCILLPTCLSFRRCLHHWAVPCVKVPVGCKGRQLWSQLPSANRERLIYRGSPRMAGKCHFKAASGAGWPSWSCVSLVSHQLHQFLSAVSMHCSCWSVRCWAEVGCCSGLLGGKQGFQKNKPKQLNIANFIKLLIGATENTVLTLNKC